MEESQRLISTIQQMEASLVDEKANGQYQLDDGELQVTYPLNRCVAYLKEKHSAMSKLHQERYEQVKSQYCSMIINRTRLTISRARRSPRIILLSPRVFVPYNPPPAYCSRLVNRSYFRPVSVVRHRAG